MNELSYRALTLYKQESIKKEYQEVNRKGKVHKNGHLRSLLLRFTSKKRTKKIQRHCCDVQCC